SDDVSAFVAGWRHENLVNGVRAGDLSTRSLGDLNMDGITNLQDWTILNVANPQLASSVSNALASVPEPTLGLLTTLIGVAAVVALARR
ncbi:MAG: hypothetical protein KDA99_08890, partial [Planctomycetales bacterium]|nr:hypothetical protein [Planctomycetales bacterium]